MVNLSSNPKTTGTCMLPNLAPPSLVLSSAEKIAVIFRELQHFPQTAANRNQLTGECFGKQGIHRCVRLIGNEQQSFLMTAARRHKVLPLCFQLGNCQPG